MRDSSLVAALRELGVKLSADHVPHGVKGAVARLSQSQSKLFTTVIVPETALGAGDGFLSVEPSDLLLKLMEAADALDWPKFMVLVHKACPEVAVSPS